MNTGLLQSLIEEDFGYEQEGMDWGRSEEHSSLVVNEKKQRWYWNSEGMGGDALAYLTKVRQVSKRAAEAILSGRGKMVGGAILKDENEQLIKPMEALVESLWQLGKTKRKYWYDRKLTDKTIDRYMLGAYDGWNLLPLYDNNQFINFQCRRDEPKKAIRYWYKIANFQPVLVNEGLLSLVDTVYITEGPIDSLLLNQEGIPAISHTGGAGYWTDKWFPLFNKVKRIFYISDNDDAGRQGAIKIAKALGQDRTFIYLFQDKPEKYDTGDYFKEGGNSKGFKEMVEKYSKNLFELGELNGRKTKSSGKIRGRFAKKY